PEGGHTVDHVLVEMDWLAALARETTLSVPRPLPARDGRLVVEAAAAGVPQPRLCAVFHWVPGQDLAHKMTEANAFRLGELMAELHLHARTYQPPAGLSVLRFDRVFPFPEPVVLFDEPYAALVTPERRAVFEEAIAWVQSSIDRLKACGEPMRILHGDLHQWNVRIYRTTLSPIDFEDLMLGWPVQDIATTLYEFPSADIAALRRAFQGGYTHRSGWPERTPGEIDSFVAARGLGLANFVLNDPNPDWRSVAGGFVEGVTQRLRGLLGG
ncbi:MAG: phosphotransferase, partial [Anaerolineae bacterium]